MSFYCLVFHEILSSDLNVLRKFVILYMLNLAWIYLRSTGELQQTRRCLDDGFYLSKDYICSSACAIFGLKDCGLVD